MLRDIDCWHNRLILLMSYYINDISYSCDKSIYVYIIIKYYEQLRFCKTWPTAKKHGSFEGNNTRTLLPPPTPASPEPHTRFACAYLSIRQQYAGVKWYINICHDRNLTVTQTSNG